MLDARSLTYFRYQIPLYTLCRRHNELHTNTIIQYDALARELILFQLNDWYYTLPATLKFSSKETIWCGPYIADINLMYHYHLLWIWRQEFIEIVDQLVQSKCHSLLHPIIQQSMRSVDIISAINRAFVKSSSPTSKDTLFHKSCVFLAGVYMCCFVAISEEFKGFLHSMDLQMEALVRMPKGPSFAILSQCLIHPEIALQLLKAMPC